MIVRRSTLVFAAPVATLLGCSDPPPAPARLGAEITLSPPSAANITTHTNCTVGTTSIYTFFLGRVTPAANTQDRVRNGTVEDGKGLAVSCTVKSVGGGAFSIAADGSGTDANSRHQSVGMTLNGSVTRDGPVAANIGTLSFYSPDTGRLRTLSGDFPGCTIGPVYVVDKGKMLADFNCPLIGDPQSSNVGCQAIGTIGVEYCKTGEEED